MHETGIVARLARVKTSKGEVEWTATDALADYVCMTKRGYPKVTSGERTFD